MYCEWYRYQQPHKRQVPNQSTHRHVPAIGQIQPLFAVLVDAGARYKDKPALPVLLGNVDDLKIHLNKDPSIAQAKHTLSHAFTPLEDVTFLHICAEFNQVACAKALIAHGADVDAKDEEKRPAQDCGLVACG